MFNSQLRRSPAMRLISQGLSFFIYEREMEHLHVALRVKMKLGKELGPLPGIVQSNERHLFLLSGSEFESLCLENFRQGLSRDSVGGQGHWCVLRSSVQILSLLLI